MANYITDMKELMFLENKRQDNYIESLNENSDVKVIQCYQYKCKKV